MAIDHILTYRYVCEEPKCHHRITTYSLDDAYKAESEHTDDHTLWRLQGKKIKPHQVLDTDHPQTITFGILYKAIDCAKENNTPYVNWNGQILLTAAPDFSNVVCYPHDIPGLIEARKN